LFSSPDLWNFELAQEVRKSQNQDLRADPSWGINPGKTLSRLQAPEDGRKLLWPETARATVSLRCSNLSYVRQLLVDEPFGLAAPNLCAPVFTCCVALEFSGRWQGKRTCQ